MIQFENVTVTVPVWGSDGKQREKAILEDISCILAEPRISVIGANGSGKSTLLRLINGLIMPSSGRVAVAGVDTQKDVKSVRKMVGFIFTDPLSQLIQSTPIEDIELSLRSKIKNRAERAEKAESLLRERGLGELAHQSIYDLSGGERQLVSLTSVLAVDPAVIVADEPSTLLDLRNKTEITQALLSLDRQLIYASHDLEFAAMADRCLVVDRGRIVFDGVPSEAIDTYRSMMGGLGRSSDE